MTSGPDQPATNQQSTDQHTTVQPTGEERAAYVRMLELIGGLQISRALAVVAELGIADQLARGPRSSADLAQASQMHGPPPCLRWSAT
jgi:hypothetical protein